VREKPNYFITARRNRTHAADVCGEKERERDFIGFSGQNAKLFLAPQGGCWNFGKFAAPPIDLLPAEWINGRGQLLCAGCVELERGALSELAGGKRLDGYAVERLLALSGRKFVPRSI
jgi:hypothetical protein